MGTTEVVGAPGAEGGLGTEAGTLTGLSRASVGTSTVTGLTASSAASPTGLLSSVPVATICAGGLVVLAGLT